MWNLGMGGDDASARNGEFALSPEHYAYEGYQAQKAEQSAAFLAGQEEVPAVLGAFNHTCLILLNGSLVAGNGTLTWYDEQFDGPLGYGACADSSVLGAVILFLLVVLIATSSGGGVSKMDARGVDVAAAARQGFADMAAKKTHVVDEDCDDERAAKAVGKKKTRKALTEVFERFDTDHDDELS